jgi:hypothetical protein
LQNKKVNKYSLLAHIYFFFNSVLLPKGLLYTTILSPLFFFNVLKQKRKTYLLPFSCFLLVFDVIHLFYGVDVRSFIVSNALFIFTYFSVIAFYHFINNYQRLGKLFRQILVFNAVMVLIALPFFFVPKPYREYFWYINTLTQGLDDFPRLALFTYEASYYALLLIPILYYYVLKFFFNSIGHNKWLTLLMVLVPMLLSLSFGVLGITLITLLFMLLFFSRRLFRYKRPFVIFCVAAFAVLAGFIFLTIYFPGNALFVRIAHVVAGTDTSANGRTTDSFGLAWRIIGLKSILFGAGLGQIKVMAIEVIHTYYRYWGELGRYDIPNAMGETLAIFGVAGVIIRLLLEVWLFFKTKVYSNYYRLALFLFIFMYQFTGSFITNIVEYVIWIFAFSQVFKQFDISPKPNRHV